MAKNVTVAGASYNAVPGVNLPVTGGGSAYFADTSDATATAEKILSGFTAYVNGAKLTGTASGGGGGEGGWKLVYSTTVTVNYTNKGTREDVLTHAWTAAEKALFADKLIFVRIRDKAGARNGYLYGGDYYTSPTPPTYIGGAYSYYNASGVASGAAGSTTGLYARTISRTGNLVITAYQTSTTTTYAINGTFAVDVFCLDEAGGDAGSYELLTSGTVTCNTAQASSEVLATITADQLSGAGNGDMIYVEIRRQGGASNGYWCGSENWIMKNPSNGVFITQARICTYLSTGGSASALTGNYGIYAYYSGTGIQIRATYNTNNKIPTTGSYTYRVYKQSYASASPFD